MIILNSHRNVFLNTFFFFFLNLMSVRVSLAKLQKNYFLKNSNIQTNNKQIKGNFKFKLTLSKLNDKNLNILRSTWFESGSELFLKCEFY